MSRTNRAAIFYKNKIEDADSIAVTSEASASTSIENILTYQPNQKWRSDSLTDQQITVTFDMPEDVRFVGLFHHNLSGGAEIRVELAHDAAFTDLVYDASFYAYASLTGLEEEPLDYGGLDGVPDVTQYKAWQKKTALFLDMQVDFTVQLMSGLDISMPPTVTRVTGGVESTDSSGELYLGRAVKASVQRFAMQFTRASSQYLSMSSANFGSYDAGRFSFQMEVRRDSLGTQQRLVDKQGTAGSDESFYMEFTAANKLKVEISTDGTDGLLLTTQTFEDLSDFIHIRFEYNKNNLTSRLRLWVDGVQVTAFDTETQGTGDINTSTGGVFIGADSAGTKCFDGKMYVPAFFSGEPPSIEKTVDSQGRTKELNTLPSIHSIVIADSGTAAIQDEILSATWTRNGSIAATNTRSENFNQIRYIDSFNPVARTLKVSEAWTQPPYENDTLRIDIGDAITTRFNDGTYYAEYLRITISDPDNAEGYIEAGYVAAGFYFQPKNGVGFEKVTQTIDPSARYTSQGGAKWVSKRNSYRKQGFTFPHLTENEVLGELSELSEQNGTYKPIIWLPYCENSARAYIGMSFGLLDQPPSIRQTGRNYLADVYTADFSIEELR